MKTTARLLLAGALAAASFGITSPASACEAGKCGPCKVNPVGYVQSGARLLDCYN